MRERRNKDAHQRQEREAHKARRRGEPELTRTALNTRSIKPTLLLVFEGQNTEYTYFNSFKLRSANLEPYRGKKHPLNVVNYAKKLYEPTKHNEVWCVFDKDDVETDDFHEAIRLAEEAGFKVAYSNQAFEYWLILHFEDHQGEPMPRTDYTARINRHINPLRANYDGEGSKIITQAFFSILDGLDPAIKKPRVQLAVDRAGKGHSRSIKSGKTPAESESCTTVYKLIKRFLKYR